MTNEEKIAQVAQVANFAAEKNISIAQAAEQFGMSRGQFYTLKNEGMKMEPTKIIKPVGRPSRQPSTRLTNGKEIYPKVMALISNGAGIKKSCLDHGVSVTGFNYWRMKYGQAAKEAASTTLKEHNSASPYEFLGQLAKRYPQISAEDLGQLFKLVH